MKNYTRPVAASSHLQGQIPARQPKGGASKTPWEEYQAQIFKTTKFRTADGVQSMTLLEAYHKSLLVSAKGGDLHATRELNYLICYLDRQERLAQPHIRSAGSIDMEKRIEQQERIARIATVFVSAAFCKVRSQLIAHYENKHGAAPGFEITPPYYLESGDVDDWVSRVSKIVRKNRPRDPNVGYGKPPVGTRWIEGRSGNPSGERRKQEDDGWQSLRDGLTQNVAVLKEGRKTKLTSVAVICRRLFEAAIKGEAPARRDVRKLLIELDRRGLLVRPAPRPRRRRSRPRDLDVRTMAGIRLANALAKLQIKQDSSEVFREVYGLDSKFHKTTARERQAALTELASLLSTKGEQH